ncbi:MAG: hypothetical protein ABI054_14315 [Planctomycetota bacterium]
MIAEGQVSVPPALADCCASASRPRHGRASAAFSPGRRGAILIASCALLLSACASDSPPLRLHDDVPIIPEVRIRWQVSGPDLPTRRKPRGWVELNATGTRGEAKDVDYSLFELSGSYVAEFSPREDVHLEIGGGVAYTRTRLDDGARDETEKRPGLRLQASPSFDLTPFLSIYAKVALTGVLTDASYDQVEAGLAWRINEFFSVTTGYRWWHYENDDFDTSAIDEVDVYSRGPVIGLAFSV